MQINGAVYQINIQNSIDAKSILHQTIAQLTLHGMVKILASMNLESLDVIYTPSHHILKGYMAEHNKGYTLVTQKSELQ